MAKLEVKFKFIGIKKPMFTLEHNDLLEAVKPLMANDYDSLREYAQNDSDDDGIKEFNLLGYYMFDYYNDSILPNPNKETYALKWKNKLIEDSETGMFGFTASEKYFKHIANLIVMNHDHFHKIALSSHETLSNTANKYIMFHIFVDEEILVHFKSLKETIYSDKEDPYFHWPLSQILASSFMYEMEVAGIDKSNKITVSCEMDFINETTSIFAESIEDTPMVLN